MVVWLFFLCVCCVVGLWSGFFLMLVFCFIFCDVLVFLVVFWWRDGCWGSCGVCVNVGLWVILCLFWFVDLFIGWWVVSCVFWVFLCRVLYMAVFDYMARSCDCRLVSRKL